MSGHSKFANIKHRKMKNDATKGKVFTKIGREIAVAVKNGGSDPEINSRLKDIIAKAKSNNMPNDTIERSIKRAAGELGDVNYEEIIYEGYGPNGVAVIVECLTDNKNRTAANVRHAFSKYKGNMGTSGCVSFLFEKKGQIVIERDALVNEEELMMIALEAGADDMISEEEGYEILCAPDLFSKVNEAVVTAGFQPLSAEVTNIASTYTELTEDDDIKNFERMLDMLEDDDDVQNVYHNCDNESQE